MKKVVLKNGLTVLYQHKPGAAVVVQVMINIGSNNESFRERGLSHFLEHILFEGTPTRPTNRDLANEIEKIGGEFNAYTTGDRTCFYVKVLKKHFSVAIEILADILQHPLFTPSDLLKEKNVVLKEIDMADDEPRFYQWILLQRHLFRRHPCRYPTYGDKNVIQRLKRATVKSYFQKHYTAGNMVIAVVGDAPNWKEQVQQKFTFPRKKTLLRPVPAELGATRNNIVKEKRSIANSYVVMGYKTIPRSHPDSYVLEVINGILGRGQSGRMFTEIRAKRGLGYEVGTQNVAEKNMGYFAVYASIDKKNLRLVQSLIIQELQRLQQLSSADLREAQEYIEGNHLLELDEAQKIADQLLFWQQVKDAKMVEEYLPKIKLVTVEDVHRVARKYFRHYTMVILEGR